MGDLSMRFTFTNLVGNIYFMAFLIVMAAFHSFQEVKDEKIFFYMGSIIASFIFSLGIWHEKYLEKIKHTFKDAE